MQAKFYIITIITIIIFNIVFIQKQLILKSTIYYNQAIMLTNEDSHNLDVKNWRHLDQNEIENLSVLGRILYLEEPPPKIANTTKQYEILVWRYGKTIENRHLKQYGNKMINPFQECPVQNCKITYNDAALTTADIVIFHLHRMKMGELPQRYSTQQIWAFLTDESPNHTFLTKNHLADYNGFFNWSMTYRMDSDIPVPYGRTIRRRDATPYLHLYKRKDVLVAILGSNCGGVNKRWDYVRELQKYIKVDVYGKCGTLQTCPGHFKLNCRDIDGYLFYLAFENSNCDEYVTEKLWWNAFEKNSIPIVMGASPASYKKLLPPDSYLNVDDYAKPEDLARHIHYLNSTGKYVEYFKWKSDFQVLNEHGYFQSESFHYCRICQALNYNNKTNKVYRNLTQFWSVKRDCHPAWNA